MGVRILDATFDCHDSAVPQGPPFRCTGRRRRDAKEIGPPRFRTAQRQHAAHRTAGYETGDVRAAPRSWSWVPVPAASRRPSRQARLGVPIQEESRFCERLFLAPSSRLPVCIHTQDQGRVLDIEAGGQPPTRSAELEASEGNGLDSTHSLGMRNERFGAPETRFETVSLRGSHQSPCDAGSNE